MNVEHRTSNIE